VPHRPGVPALIRGLGAASRRRRRKPAADGKVNRPLRVPGNEAGTLNFVPVDYVVDAMTEIGSRESSIGGTYHLTNPAPTENSAWLPAVCDLLGVEGIRFVSADAFDKEPIARMEALFQRQMAFYYMYLQGEPRFDCRNTLAALEGTGIACPGGSAEFVRHMIGWYVDLLNSGRGETGAQQP
jgi:nucleoside-diphosphate-sugar epimerase